LCDRCKKEAAVIQNDRTNEQLCLECSDGTPKNRRKKR
jgi:hypothetical protein